MRFPIERRDWGGVESYAAIRRISRREQLFLLFYQNGGIGGKERNLGDLLHSL